MNAASSVPDLKKIKAGQYDVFMDGIRIGRVERIHGGWYAYPESGHQPVGFFGIRADAASALLGKEASD